MATDFISKLFNLPNKVAVVIGGGGHLCGAMAVSLAKAGVRVAGLDDGFGEFIVAH